MGLITRSPYEDDRRSILVGLTTEGIELHTHHNRMHIQLTEDITRNLDESSIDVLTKCFEKMNQEF